MNELIVVFLYTLAFLCCGELLRRYFNNLADNANIIKKVVSYREYSYFSKKKKEKLIQKENILIEKERFLNIRKLLVQYRELIIDKKAYEGDKSSFLIKFERVFRYHFNIVFNAFFVDNKINKDKNNVFILTDVQSFNSFIEELTSIPNKPTPELNGDCSPPSHFVSGEASVLNEKFGILVSLAATRLSSSFTLPQQAVTT
jgi:hypothetical protein